MVKVEIQNTIDQFIAEHLKMMHEVVESGGTFVQEAVLVGPDKRKLAIMVNQCSDKHAFYFYVQQVVEVINAVEALVFMETWTVSSEDYLKDEKGNVLPQQPRPAEHPNRHEAIILYRIQPDANVSSSFSQQFSHDGKKIVWDEPVTTAGGKQYMLDPWGEAVAAGE
jgi:hypothetical protein